MKRQIKVRYLSPDHLKYINPNLIDSVTLKNGSMVKLNSPQKNSQYFYRKGQNQGFNTYCGQAKNMGQVRNFYPSTYVFRGGKKKAAEIEVPEDGVQKEGLLTDILTGGGYNPEGQGQSEGRIYIDDGQQESTPQEYGPNPSQNPYNEGYSDPNSYNPMGQTFTTGTITIDENYPSSNPQEENRESNLPNGNYPPQGYPQQPEEQIPIQTPYIPIQPTPEESEYPNQPYPYQPQQPQYDPYPNQQPMQPIFPPQVVPASNAARTNAPVQQGNNNTDAPKSFKDLFKEARKQAKNKLKNNNNFRARRKEVQEDEFCPYCNSSNPEY